MLPGWEDCPGCQHEVFSAPPSQEIGSSQPGSTGKLPRGDLAAAGARWVPFAPLLPSLHVNLEQGGVRHPQHLRSLLQTHPGLDLQPRASPKPNFGIWAARNCGLGLEDDEKASNSGPGAAPAAPPGWTRSSGHIPALPEPPGASQIPAHLARREVAPRILAGPIPREHLDALLGGS